MYHERHVSADMNMHSDWIARFRNRGFVGPRYTGIVGKLRLLHQHWLVRTDVVLIATPEGKNRPPKEANPSVSLLLVKEYVNFEQYIPEFESEYYPGYASTWRHLFEWGETLALALLNGRVAGFGWLQEGTPEGLRCYYGCLFANEYRVLRVGVLPSYRRRGVNTTFYVLLLRHLFRSGVTRVYVDCNKDNIPSLKAQIRGGFRPIGEITVLPLLDRHFIRWKPLSRAVVDTWAELIGEVAAYG